jgi:hypothetical protein
MKRNELQASWLTLKPCCFNCIMRSRRVIYEHNSNDCIEDISIENQCFINSVMYDCESATWPVKDAVWYKMKSQKFCVKVDIS